MFTHYAGILSTLILMVDGVGSHLVKHCPPCTKQFNFSRTTKEKEWNVEIYPPQINWVPWSQHQGEGRFAWQINVSFYTQVKFSCSIPKQDALYIYMQLLDICSCCTDAYVYII